MGGEVNSCSAANYSSYIEYTSGGYYDHQEGACYANPTPATEDAKPVAAAKKKLAVKTNFGTAEKPKAQAIASGFAAGALGTVSAISQMACGYIAERTLDEPRDAGVPSDGGHDAGEGGYDAGHDAGDAGAEDAGHDAGDAGGVCDNPPTAPTLSAPADNATNVSIKPAFTWVAGTDPDTGDTVDNNLQVCADSACASVVLNKPGLGVGVTNYTPSAAEALANNTPYWWRVLSVDKCPTSTASLIRKFTTEKMCVPWSILETDFTSGTATDLTVNGGSVSLAEDSSAWTVQYDGSVLPDAATPAWTPNGTTTSNSVLAGEFTLYSLASNLTDYYSIFPTFNNAVGGKVRTRLKINGMDEASSPNTLGYAVRIADGSRAVDFTFFSTAICEPINTGNCFTVPGGTSTYHNYDIEFKGNDYRVYVNGAMALDGTGVSLSGAGGQNYLRFGDHATNPDVSATMDYLYYYNAGDKLPTKSKGTYVSAPPIDSGATDNDFGGGSLGWLPSTAPGAVSLAVRSGNSADLSAAPWSSEYATNPALLPAGTLGRYMQWRLTLNGPSSTLSVDEVDGSKTCP